MSGAARVAMGVMLATCGPAAGCSVVLSTLTPAAPTPHRHLRGSFGVGANVPVGEILELVEHGEEVAEQLESGQLLSQDEMEDLLGQAVALVLNPPNLATQGQLRWGADRRWDLGLRIAGGAYRVDARLRVLESGPDPLDGSVGLGLGVYSYSTLARRPARVAFQDFLRLEVDVPVLFGWSAPFGHFWFGPKLVFSASWTDFSLLVDETQKILGDIRGVALYYGAQVGGALGWKWIWLALELTVAGLLSSADARSSVASVDAAPGGLIIYPAAAIIVQLEVPAPDPAPRLEIEDD